MNRQMRRIKKENDANNDEDKVPYVNQGGGAHSSTRRGGGWKN